MSDGAETIPSSRDTNFGPATIGVNWAVFGPSTIDLLVSLCLVTRVWITHNFGWDDAVILLAHVGGQISNGNRRLTLSQIVDAVGMGFVMLEVYYGLRRHVQLPPADHYVGFLKYNFLTGFKSFYTYPL